MSRRALDLSSIARKAAVPLAIFGASRLVVIAAAYIAKTIAGAASVGDVLARWDGTWFIEVATNGYPETLPSATGNAGQSRIAFFPVYPLLIRGISGPTGLSEPLSGAVIATLAGAAAAVAIWFLAEQLADSDFADRSVALYSFFPGAFALSMVYSDALFLLLAAACFIALISRKWFGAGITAAIAGATRPNGLVLAACCLAAAVIAVRARKEWKALIAPALAPVGALAFLFYLYRHTGDPLVWSRAQTQGWGQGFDFGVSTARKVMGVLIHPLADFNLLSSTLTLGAAAIAFFLLYKWWPKQAFWLFAIYGLGIVLPSIVSPAFTLTPRTMLVAFPLVLAWTRHLKGLIFTGVVAASGALMATLMVLAGSTIAFTP